VLFNTQHSHETVLVHRVEVVIEVERGGALGSEAADQHAKSISSLDEQCHGNSDSSAVRRRLASSDETDIVYAPPLPAKKNIRHAIWLYARFTMSFRDVEELLPNEVLTHPTRRSDGGSRSSGRDAAIQSPGSAQRFLAVHAATFNVFTHQRHLLRRLHLKELGAGSSALGGIRHRMTPADDFSHRD
jgi:hypothetical protein